MRLPRAAWPNEPSTGPRNSVVCAASVAYRSVTSWERWFSSGTRRAAKSGVSSALYGRKMSCRSSRSPWVCRPRRPGRFLRWRGPINCGMWCGGSRSRGRSGSGGCGHTGGRAWTPRGSWSKCSRGSPRFCGLWWWRSFWKRLSRGSPGERRTFNMQISLWLINLREKRYRFCLFSSFKARNDVVGVPARVTGLWGSKRAHRQAIRGHHGSLRRCRCGPTPVQRKKNGNTLCTGCG